MQGDKRGDRGRTTSVRPSRFILSSRSSGHFHELPDFTPDFQTVLVRSQSRVPVPLHRSEGAAFLLFLGQSPFVLHVRQRETGCGRMKKGRGAHDTKVGRTDDQPPLGGVFVGQFVLSASGPLFHMGPSSLGGRTLFGMPIPNSPLA